MKATRSFASDNNAGVHPEMLKAIASVNQGHVVGYGDDPYTQSAIVQFRRRFGADTETFFVFNGTAANCLSLKALTNSFHAVICAEAAHIYVDECGAPEKFTGCKLIPVPAKNGKLTVEIVRAAYHGIADEHHVQPRVISITQATEVGTVYKPNEIRDLAGFAHDHGMFLHVDGARIANAAAASGLGLREATRDLGVDALSFGATKNGALGAEAVLFFNPELAANFKFYRKHRMAQLLKREVSKIPQVKIIYGVEANGVFAQIPRKAIAKLQKRYFFYVWNEAQSVVRWMCSWDTTADDVKQFTHFLRQSV